MLDGPDSELRLLEKMDSEAIIRIASESRG
jgi:hypothetical protein